MNAECFLGVLRAKAREKGKGETMKHLCAKSLKVSLKVIRKIQKYFNLGECMILFFKNAILAVIVTCLLNFYAWKSLHQNYTLFLS